MCIGCCLTLCYFNIYIYICSFFFVGVGGGGGLYSICGDMQGYTRMDRDV